MSDIAITLILVAVAIFAAGYITAKVTNNHRRLRQRIRQALHDAIRR